MNLKTFVAVVERLITYLGSALKTLRMNLSRAADAKMRHAVAVVRQHINPSRERLLLAALFCSLISD